MEDIFLTRSVEKCWKERPGLGTSVIAKYFGTTNGVFRQLTGQPYHAFTILENAHGTCVA